MQRVSKLIGLVTIDNLSSVRFLQRSIGDYCCAETSELLIILVDWLVNEFLYCAVTSERLYLS